MLSINSYQGNEEIPILLNDKNYQNTEIPNISEVTEQAELSYTDGGNVKCHYYFGEWFGNLLWISMCS